MNEETRLLLEALAPYSPINQDEQGGCVWCGGGEPGRRYSNAYRYLTDHDHDCPWLQARQALGDVIPAARD
jgi:hypothetical protein